MQYNAILINRKEGLDSGSIHTGPFVLQVFERAFNKELNAYLSLTYA